MRRILLIEDDRDISNLVRIHLTDLQYEVEQTFDGKEGLMRAMERQHCLIVLDLMLPGMDGITICQRLRAEKVGTPILMLTSKAEEIDKVLGLETGADDYMTKPFSIRELVATALNINSGSAGDQNLYELFDTYLSDPSARNEINSAVRHARGVMV